MKASDKLLKLKSIAESASPGPWGVYKAGKVRTEMGSTEFHVYKIPGPDSNFVAAFNPQTAIALIDQMLKMREALEMLKQGYAMEKQKYNSDLLITRTLKQTDQVIEDL